MLNSRLPNTRDNASEATSPIAAPIAISRTPLRSTSVKMSARVAPIAIRKPISCVRRATRNEITPYSPTIAISKPVTANIPTSSVSNSGWSARSRTRCESVEISTGTVGSIVATCERTHAPTVSGGKFVFTMIVAESSQSSGRFRRRR